MYAERYDALGIRLYITHIRDGDDGIYTCKARVADTGEMLEQDTKMFLYGNLHFVQSLLSTFIIRILFRNCVITKLVLHRQFMDLLQIVIDSSFS